jgi:phosphoribosyl 1,2-cyclic phosphodiesterase
MKFKFQGTRGSYPSPKEEHVFYGGNTPCVELCTEDQRLILDAGTGILGLDFEYYAQSPRIDILLTHLHMDHIQGLAFFKPLFFKDKEVHIWGPRGNNDSLRSRLNRYLSPPLFPLPLRDLPSKLHIHEVSNSRLRIGPFQIRSAFVIHPGPTVGYRIEHAGKVLTYIPDHEPMVGTTDLYPKDKWVSGLDLCKDADVLIHDAMYTEQEYPNKIGWGHSSTKHVLQIARRAGVKKLFLFHHDPDHSDRRLDQIIEELKGQQESFEVHMAEQGQVYEL